MADLTEIQSSQSVKIAGANSSGAEDNWMEVDVNGNAKVIISDVLPATQNITAIDTGTTSLVGANGQVFYVGSPTANSAASFAISSTETVTVESSIIGAGGTLVVEVSMDGGTFWFRPNVYQVSTQSYGNSFIAPFMAVVNTSGMTNIRVRAITSWTGTGTIRVVESANSRAMTIADALPAGANVIGGVTQSGTWNITNISGTVSLPTGAATAALQTQPGVDIGDVTINNSTGAAAVNIQDGGNSITVDGSVTVNNAAGASAVNIQDGGNTITVDGTVNAAQSGNWSVRIDDGSGNLITSTTLTGTASTKQGLDVNILPNFAGYYCVPVQIRQSAASAANTTVFTIRNPAASTKTVVIESMNLIGTFDSGTPITRTLLRYSLHRFSTATPTGGTAETVIKLNNSNAATQVTDVRFLDTGLTTTGVVFENPFSIIGIPATDGAIVQYKKETTPLILAPGEGFCIRLNVAAVIGQGISGEIAWSER